MAKKPVKKTVAPTTYIKMNGRDVRLELRPPSDCSPGVPMKEPSIIVGRRRMELRELFAKVDKGTGRVIRKWFYSHGQKHMAAYPVSCHPVPVAHFV